MKSVLIFLAAFAATLPFLCGCASAPIEVSDSQLNWLQITRRPADADAPHCRINLMGVGYIAFLQTTKIWAKQLFPKDSRGQFEGIWVLFFVLIPMIGGSLIGQAVVQTGGETFLNAESGRMEYIPNGNIFVAGMIIILLALIPAVLAARSHGDRSRGRS